MAKFLTTSGTAHQIEQIIKNASKSVTLVTPYLKLSKNIVERLADAVKKNIKLTIIYGKDENVYDQIRLIEKLPGLSLYFYQNLHAKCYLNESEMIISSMNLHEYSEKNNREMSVYFLKNEDSQLYNEGLIEVESIIDSSKLKISNLALPLVTAITKAIKVEIEPIDINVNEISDNNYHFFYLPNLFEQLKNKLPEFAFNFSENKIYSTSFPITGLTIEIDSRVDFKFNNSKVYDKVKNTIKNDQNFNTADYRFYWNHNQLNVYMPKKYEFEKSENGIIDLSNKFNEVVNITVAELIKLKL